MLERARQDSDHKCRKYFVWPSRGVRTRPGRRSAPDCSILGGAPGHSNIAATAESTYGRHRFTRLARRKRPTGRSYRTRWSIRAQPVAKGPLAAIEGCEVPRVARPSTDAKASSRSQTERRLFGEVRVCIPLRRCNARNFAAKLPPPWIVSLGIITSGKRLEVTLGGERIVGPAGNEGEVRDVPVIGEAC